MDFSTADSKKSVKLFDALQSPVSCTVTIIYVNIDPGWPIIPAVIETDRIAALVERVLFVFVPLAALLYPMSKFLPQIYDWIMHSRIMRLYDEMRSIGSEVEAEGQGHDIKAMIARLDQLEERGNGLQLPRFYAIMLYTLRSHINLIRDRLEMKPDKRPH